MKFLTLFFLCFIAGCATTAVSDSPPSFAGYEKYHLNTRHDDWELTSPVPMDKSYIELSEDQQKIVKDYYSDLGENDTPPFPVRGTQTLYKTFIKDPYMLSSHAHATEIGLVVRSGPEFRRGNLVVIATINKAGKTEKVKILESPTSMLDRGVTKILLNTEFDPGTCNGEPCQREFYFQIDSGISIRTDQRIYTVHPPKKDNQN